MIVVTIKHTTGVIYLLRKVIYDIYSELLSYIITDILIIEYRFRIIVHLPAQSQDADFLCPATTFNVIGLPTLSYCFSNATFCASKILNLYII